MKPSYRDLLCFHIEAQQGMFIEETGGLESGAGVWVFSAREDDPSWNVFYALDPVAALREKPRIEQEFRARGREPVWYLVDGEESALVGTWTRFSGDQWMICAAPSASAVCGGLHLRRVQTGAEVARFNQLYCDTLWDGAPDPGAILPIPAQNIASQDCQPQDCQPQWWGARNGLETRHWIGSEGMRDVVILTAISRGGLTAVYNVGTLPSERGRGLGSALMRAVMAAEARLGAEWFFLGTERDKPLESFYRGVGFRTLVSGGYYRKALA